MAESSSRTAVIAALIGNILIAVTKAVAAAISGSSAMLSEAVHSTVDSGNEILLLYGQHRAGKPPDRLHPLGYGREIYFWSFVVALLIFALGAGVSIYEGVKHVLNPRPMADPLVNYIVYAVSALFEGISWSFGWSAFSRVSGDRPIFAAVEASKDPPSFMVLFEDSAALVGLAIAAVATFATTHFDAPWADGTGSILIGLVLAAVAVLLARESKALLIGERARPELSNSIREIAAHEPGVIAVEGILTSQLSPDEVVANVGLDFAEDLRTPDIERIIGHLETELRKRHPELFRVFVRPHPDMFQGEPSLLDVGPG
ncbi:MAG TPA: cation diffusion facilitator family transporter [Sphingomicrobium sp.]|nr:cation diffusion facilitator family transporter [Sphingomicrobium sp.]